GGANCGYTYLIDVLRRRRVGLQFGLRGFGSCNDRAEQVVEVMRYACRKDTQTLQVLTGQMLLIAALEIRDIHAGSNVTEKGSVDDARNSADQDPPVLTVCPAKPRLRREWSARIRGRENHLEIPFPVLGVNELRISFADQVRQWKTGERKCLHVVEGRPL